MDGVTIIEEFEFNFFIVKWWMFLIPLVLFFAGITLHILSHKFLIGIKYASYCYLMASIILFSLLIAKVFSYDLSKPRFIVSVDKSVSMDEFKEHYTILSNLNETKNIYIIEEK